MARKQAEDSFSEEEAARRFEATLRGALSTLPTPLKTVPPKRPKVKRKAAAKSEQVNPGR